MRFAIRVHIGAILQTNRRILFAVVWGIRPYLCFANNFYVSSVLWPRQFPTSHRTASHCSLYLSHSHHVDHLCLVAVDIDARHRFRLMKNSSQWNGDAAHTQSPNTQSEHGTYLLQLNLLGKSKVSTNACLRFPLLRFKHPLWPPVILYSLIIHSVRDSKRFDIYPIQCVVRNRLNFM